MTAQRPVCLLLAAACRGTGSETRCRMAQPLEVDLRARLFSMRPSARCSDPTRACCRYDQDAYDAGSSATAADDPQYGGRVDMQGFAAKSPFNGLAQRSPEATLRVRDGSARWGAASCFAAPACTGPVACGTASPYTVPPAATQIWRPRQRCPAWLRRWRLCEVH